MNEGWASYWHSKIMTQKALKDDEVIDYADHHSGTMGTRPGALNPYKLGIELFRDIEERWNKGRFGKEWDECDDLRARRAWDRKLGLGRDKIFEVPQALQRRDLHRRPSSPPNSHSSRSFSSTASTRSATAGRSSTASSGR